MARSSVETFGLLNRWPHVMHEDVWRFNQIDGLGVRQNSCSTQSLYIQFERDYIATALHTAVHQAAEYLGFLPVPTYIEDEIVPLDLSVAWNKQDVQLKYGYLSAIGRQLKLEIAKDTSVTYSDTNSDTVQDLASITVTASVPVDEIRVFFRSADGAEEDAHASWEIDGLTRKDNGDGTVTLTGHKALFVHPKTVWTKEYSDPNFTIKYAGDTARAGDFVTSVDVYRVYLDTDQVVTLVAENGETYDVWGQVKDAKYATLSLSKFNETDPTPSYPQFAKVSYVAGYPRVRDLMYRPLETALIRYANVQTPQQICFCDRTLAMWQEDRKVPEAISQVEIDNPPPFGITRAGLELAQVIEPIALKFKGRERRKYPNAESVRYLKS